MQKNLWVATLAGLLVACGGSDDDDQARKPIPPQDNSTIKTGLFTYNAASGVKYETNSGLSGTTSNKGEFQYKDGDYVSFSIGDTQIGDRVVAKPVVMESDLSQDRDSRINIITFLQSFDADRDTENGIQISSKAHEALSGTRLNFQQDVNHFSQDLSFLKAVYKAGLETPIEAETALKQAQKAFYKDIQGVWQYPQAQSGSHPDVLMYIDANGEFTLGQFTTADENGKPGVEVGKLDWDATNTRLLPKINIDTNGRWGLSGNAEDGKAHHLQFDGTALILEEPHIQGVYKFNKVGNQNNSIVGSWRYQEGQIFSFFENGTYLMLDPLGDASEDRCGGPGVEVGQYKVSGSTLMIHSISIDTNGCAGLSDNKQNLNLNFKIDGNKMLFTPPGEGTFSLDRL